MVKTYLKDNPAIAPALPYYRPSIHPWTYMGEAKIFVSTVKPDVNLLWLTLCIRPEDTDSGKING